jgi:hypothetical protein
MTRRRTAERAVIEAAKRVSAKHSHTHWWDEVKALDQAVEALEALDLEPATAVRTKGLPLATSEAAAAYMSKRVHDVVGEVFGQILSVCRQGAFGLTTDAVEQRLRRSHQSVSPRVTELRDQGWITDSGQKRKTRYGQDAVVWTPTPAAMRAAEQVKEWSW